MSKIKTLLLFTGILILPVTLVKAVEYSTAIPVVVEDFETPDKWDIDFSPLRCQEWAAPDWDNTNSGATPNNTDPNAPATNEAKPAAEAANWLKWLNIDSIDEKKRNTFLPLALQQDENNKSIMGLKSCWITPGYNWVSVSPKEPLYTPSFPVSFSTYVWGNNYKYSIYLTIKNSDGDFYNLYLGNLNFKGWRNLKINFPRYVFSSNSHNDNSKLQIVKLKILANPNEDSKGFYTYFDNLTVQQSFEQRGMYEGSSLNDEKW